MFSPDSVDILSQSMSSFPKVVCTGLFSVGALASTCVQQTHEGHVYLFLKAVILLAVLILCFYPTGSHGAVEIQLPGGAPTLLRPPVTPQAYVFASPTGQKNDRARAAPRAVHSGFLLLLKMSDLI